MSDTEKEIRIKRLTYRSWHRGCKETDVVLGYFANNHLTSLTDTQLDLFELLMDEHDSDIWKWLVGTAQPENKAYLPLLDILREYSDSHEHTKQLVGTSAS